MSESIANIPAPHCKHCKIELSPGQAIDQTYTGTPDFPGKEVVTMSAGGPDRLVECLKCSKCGYSVTTVERSA